MLDLPMTLLRFLRGFRLALSFIGLHFISLLRISSLSNNSTPFDVLLAYVATDGVRFCFGRTNDIIYTTPVLRQGTHYVLVSHYLFTTPIGYNN